MTLRSSQQPKKKLELEIYLLSLRSLRDELGDILQRRRDDTGSPIRPAPVSFCPLRSMKTADGAVTTLPPEAFTSFT